MKKLTKQLNHYIPLVGMLLAATLGAVHFAQDRIFQATLAIAAAVSYVVWGIVHHQLHHDLDVSTFVEYVAIAALGLLIVLSLIFRY